MTIFIAHHDKPKSFADSFRATSCACDTTFLCRRKKTVLGGSSKGRRPFGDTRTAVTQQGRAEGQQQHLLHCGHSRNRCISPRHKKKPWRPSDGKHFERPNERQHQKHREAGWSARNHFFLEHFFFALKIKECNFCAR